MRSVYSQSRKRTSRGLAAAALLCLALGLGGCNSTGPMASLVAEDDVTSSIPAPPPPPPAFNAQDWALASKALEAALDPQGPGGPIVWENAASGARGTMTPVGFVYQSEGQTCRAFLAEIGGKAPGQRLQGRGCREGQGAWVVSDLKPFGS